MIDRPRRSWLDWRRVLIYTHRWLGIAGCLVFAVWFVSGVVMMYQRMPRLSVEERLARIAPFDASRLQIPPADAAAAADVDPGRIRVGMLGARPVYRLEAAGEWTTVYGDTGEPLSHLASAEAVAIVRALYPEHASTTVSAGRLEQPDQWTIDGGLPRFLPLHRVSLGDPDGTYVYVSERTGEPVMKTTARSRAWGYAGAVLHWTYFTPFRLQREVWRYTIIYAALIGCVLCLSGLIAGIWRFSPSARFRLKRQRSHSPYAGWMWWHHYAGLVFGLFSFTWALSGALSLTPWDWAPSTEASEEQQAAMRGGSLNLAAMTVPAITRAAASLGHAFEVKEIELLQFEGRPLARAFRAPSATEGPVTTTPDVSAIYSMQLPLDQGLTWLDSPAPPFEHLERDRLSTSVRAAMPYAAVRDEQWLTTYDNYYYDRWGTRPLPVLRVRFSDAEATWLYVDARSGLIVARHTPRSRANRWLYNGLHSLDFPFLYPRRPLWDAVLIALSLGGLGLTVTTMIPAWRRLKRHLH